MLRSFRGAFSRRKIDVERAALSDFAFDLNPSLMLLYDAIHGSQSQPGAFPDFLGRKKRVENMGDIFRGNAAASVNHAQTHVKASPKFWIQTSVCVFYGFESCSDRKASTLGHGVACINREVHEDLIDHPAVGVN